MNDLGDHQPDVPGPGEDPTADRLRRLGTADIPSAVRTEHLQAMSASSTDDVAPAARREKRFGRLAVAMAAIVGFLAGSTGLAVAGALPDPAQDAAADVLSVVGLDVPAGKEGKRGPCVSAAAKLADPAEKQAAKDACPKGPFGNGPDGAPGQSGEKPGKSGDRGRSADAPGQVGKADDPCRGRPPWAGHHDLTDDEVAAAKAQREACPDDTDVDEDEVDKAGEVEGEPGG